MHKIARRVHSAVSAAGYVAYRVSARVAEAIDRAAYAAEKATGLWYARRLQAAAPHVEAKAQRIADVSTAVAAEAREQAKRDKAAVVEAKKERASLTREAARIEGYYS